MGDSVLSYFKAVVLLGIFVYVGISLLVYTFDITTEAYTKEINSTEGLQKNTAGRLEITRSCDTHNLTVTKVETFGSITVTTDQGNVIGGQEEDNTATVDNLTIPVRTGPPKSAYDKPSSELKAECRALERKIEGQVRSHRLPDVICMGSKKGGTGTLNQFLTLHPLLAGQQPEPHFFDKEDDYFKGLTYYKQKMLVAGTKEQMIIEKTPRYFVYDAAPSRVHAMNSFVKLLLILRDPVKRLISDYDHERILIRRKTIENDRSLESLVFNEDGSLNVTYEPVRVSMYDVNVERWLSFFPRKQLLVIDGDLFLRDPFLVLQQVEDFLGLPRCLSEDLFVYEEDKHRYCPAAKKCLSQKGVKHPTYPDEFLSKVRKAYEPHMERLYDLIGHKFVWSWT